MGEGRARCEEGRPSDASDEDPWLQREEIYSCARESKTIVTRVAQKERLRDARNWKQDRLQGNTTVEKCRITIIAECEAVYRRVDSS